MPATATVKVTKDGLSNALESVERLTDRQVLVGIPAQNAPRKETPITNASIAYVQEFGSPRQNIPARPFLIPGMGDVNAKLAQMMGQGARLALNGDPAAIDRTLTSVGLTASSAVKARINAGIPPALSERTLKERAARGRKGAIQELANRASGKAPSLTLAKPLVDTGQLRNAITYAIRERVL